MTELANLSTGEIITYEPLSSVELEAMIRELGDRLENAVPVIRDLWQARYAAERKLIEERAKAVIRSKASTVTERRAEADVATIGLRYDFDTAKETLHAAEELQKALTAKLYGLLNINKAHMTAYQVGGVGR